MFNGVKLSTSNYNSLLIGSNKWGLQLQSNVQFDGGLSKYTISSIAEQAKNNLISLNNWIIYDGGAFVPTFRSIWDTTKFGVSSFNQIKLPLTNNGIYNFSIQWGDGNNNTITAWDQPEIIHNYTIPGVYNVN